MLIEITIQSKHKEKNSTSVQGMQDSKNCIPKTTINAHNELVNLCQLVNLCNAPQFTHLVLVPTSEQRNQLMDNFDEHFKHTGSIFKTPLFKFTNRLLCSAKYIKT